MSKEKIITETEATQNPILGMTAEGGDSELKEFLVNYTGTKLDKEQVNFQSLHFRLQKKTILEDIN